MTKNRQAARPLSFGAFATIALLLAACTTPPPTSPEAVYGGRPGYVLGYLQADQYPDIAAILPSPPAAGSAAFAADEERYRTTRALRDTARWSLAARDADLTFPNAAQTYSCALGIAITPEATPNLNILLRRVRTDASRANDKAKALYQRRRPVNAYGDTSCTPHDKLRDDSYPSGHTSIGWAWALTLAELAPENATAILARGLAYGDSRVVCGVHWQSDVEAGRLVGAGVVSRLHADPVYAAQLPLARREIAAQRAAGNGPTIDCAAEAAALKLR